MRPSSHRRRLLLPLVALLALLLAACSGGEEQPEEPLPDVTQPAVTEAPATQPAAPSEVTTEDVEEAAQAFVACMRDRGIDVPDLAAGETPDPELLQDPEFRAAAQECGSTFSGLLNRLELDPQERARLREQSQAIAECVREQGVDVPELRIGPNGLPEPVEVDTERLRAAVDTCAQQLNGG